MGYAKTSERREKRLLREQMRSMGLGYRDIAAEFACRYRLRPRAAWREAYGWSLQDTADRINAFRGNTGLDPGGFAGMIQPHSSQSRSSGRDSRKRSITRTRITSMVGTTPPSTTRPAKMAIASCDPP